MRIRFMRGPSLIRCRENKRDALLIALLESAPAAVLLDRKSMRNGRAQSGSSARSRRRGQYLQPPPHFFQSGLHDAKPRSQRRLAELAYAIAAHHALSVVSNLELELFFPCLNRDVDPRRPR